jgi:hypothetical protein
MSISGLKNGVSMAGIFRAEALMAMIDRGWSRTGKYSSGRKKAERVSRG